MPDVGLINAIRELSQLVRSQVGGKMPILPFGGSDVGGMKPGEVPQGWLDKQKEYLEAHTDGFRSATDEHLKGIKKSNEEFFEKSARLNLQLAPIYEAVHLYGKYNLSIPAQMMGGAAGRGMRTGLDVSRDVGQMGFDVASALATFIPGVGMMAGMGIQAMGRAGGAGIVGDLLFRRGSTEVGLQRTYMEDFEVKKWQNEESAMFRARTGRLGAQSEAWGGPNVGSLIKGLVGSLNEDPHALQAMIADAFKIGGTRGIKNIDEETITKMVQEGYGTAAEVIAAQATAGRYGYGKSAAADMANRTGLTMDQVLPMMQQTRMQYYMYRQGTAESINKFVANTTVGAMNPSMGLSMVSQAAQGAASVTDEASSMLQYRSFLEANPGSTYLDFVEAKKNGFASEKWRRFVGGAARTYGSGGQAMRIAGAGILGTAPDTLTGIASTYAEGMGPDVYRAGARKISADEAFAQRFGSISASALESNIESIGKYVVKFGENMTIFASEMADIVKGTGDVVDDAIAIRKKLAAESDPLKTLLRGDSTSSPIELAH
jgi:hypothetical protein